MCWCSGSTCIVVDGSISWKMFFAVQNKSCKRARAASAREGEAQAHLLPRQGRAQLPRLLGLRAAAPMLGLHAAAPIVRVVCGCPDS